jgi:hypothetical protein
MLVEVEVEATKVFQKLITLRSKVFLLQNKVFLFIVFSLDLELETNQIFYPLKTKNG